MMTRITIAALAACLATPAAAERMAAEVECAPTGSDLEYRCLYALTAGEAPVPGARFTVKPDMPSMPMAHNIAPVEAVETETPGTYESVFTLDMHGRWSLRLDIAEPRRDVVIEHFDFVAQDAGAQSGHGGHGAHGTGEADHGANDGGHANH